MVFHGHVGERPVISFVKMALGHVDDAVDEDCNASDCDDAVTTMLIEEPHDNQNTSKP